MILTALCGLGGGERMPTETKVLLQGLEVACPQSMAIENYLANGDQKGEEGRLWILLLIDRTS